MSDSVVHRLSPEMLSSVKKQAGFQYHVNSNTTPLEAGVQIGMGKILEILQNGFTTSAPAPTTKVR